MFASKILSAAALFLAGTAAHAACSNGLPLQTSAVPSLPGRVVFQANDSNNKPQLFLFDFNNGQQTNLSSAWALSTPLNPAFSPNGKYIAFTAVTSNGCCRDDFVWQIGTSAPIDVTNKGNTYKSEDPKWSPDGQRLVIKQNANIAILGLTFNASGVPSPGTTTALTTDGTAGTSSESSAPYFSADSKYVYYARGICSANVMNYGTCSSAAIYKISSSGGTHTIYSANGHYAYYPIVRDLSTVFYTGWITAALPGKDQILIQSDSILGPGTYIDEPFNDCNSNNSDVASVDSDYILFSSTSTQVTTGSYKPVIANLPLSQVWDLTRIGVGSGTTGDILGMSYTAAR